MKSALMCMAAFGALVLLPSSASAYRVYTTTSGGVKPPFGCQFDQPRKLHWNTGEIPYRLETIDVAGLDPDQAEQAILSSFATWNAEVQCEPPRFVYDGVSQNPFVGYDGVAETDENVILWVMSDNEWLHGPGVLALTTLTYSTCTGVIVDADLELNAAAFNFNAGAKPPQGGTDVQNTVTHEAGHMLGLDHSVDPEATMYASAPDAEVRKRDLEKDDILGLCCLYGPDSPMVVKTPQLVCEGAPKTAELKNDDVDAGGGEGCQGAPGGPGWLALALAAVLISGRRPRRERRRTPAPAPPR